VLAAASAVISLVSHANSSFLEQATGGGPATLPLQIPARLLFYVGKLVWPAHLSCVYADVGPFSWTRPALLAALACVIATVLLALRWAGRRPALLACAGWFALALAPVLGLVHYSWIVLSDKYAYLAIPAAALALAGALRVAWRAELPARPAAVAAALVLLGAEAAVSRATIAHWRDSLTLWRHIAQVSPREPGSHIGLGGALVHANRWREARGEFETATALDTTFWLGPLNVAFACIQLGDLPAADAAAAHALRLQPQNGEVIQQAARVAQAMGRWQQAEQLFRAVLAVHPFDAPTLVSLAQVLDRLGRRDESMACLRRAMELHPGSPKAEFGLGHLLIEQSGFSAEARAHLETALRLSPDWLPVMNELAWGLAATPDSGLRDGPRALALAARASRLAGDSAAVLLDTRAVAEAATGRFADAAASEQRAIARAIAARQDSLARVYAARQARFRRGEPWSDPARSR